MTGIKTRTQTQEQKELYKQHIADKADCTNLVTYMSAYNKAEREQNNVEKIQAAMLKKWARFQGIGNRDDSLPPPRDIAGKIHFAYLVSKSEAGRRNTNKNSFYIESGSQGAILFKGRNYPDCLFTPRRDWKDEYYKYITSEDDEDLNQEAKIYELEIKGANLDAKKQWKINFRPERTDPHKNTYIVLCLRTEEKNQNPWKVNFPVLHFTNEMRARKRITEVGIIKASTLVYYLQKYAALQQRDTLQKSTINVDPYTEDQNTHAWKMNQIISWMPQDNPVRTNSKFIDLFADCIEVCKVYEETNKRTIDRFFPSFIQPEAAPHSLQNVSYRLHSISDALDRYEHAKNRKLRARAAQKLPSQLKASSCSPASPETTRISKQPQSQKKHPVQTYQSPPRR